MRKVNGGSLLAVAMGLAASAVPNPVRELRRMGYRVRAPKVPNEAAQVAAQAKRDRKNAKRTSLLKKE